MCSILYIPWNAVGLGFVLEYWISERIKDFIHQTVTSKPAEMEAHSSRHIGQALVPVNGRSEPL
jgi:hypothetical protein